LHCIGILAIAGRMNRAWLLLLILACAAVGCSNRPIAGTLDCLFPSKVKYKSDPDGRTAPVEPFEPGTDRDRGLPRIGDPIRPSETDVPFRRNVGPTGRRGAETELPEPLPLPGFRQ
jgi:hypothetical protein